MSQPILCRTLADCEEPLKRLAETKTFIYDVETDGLDWRTNMIVGHVLTFGPAPQDTYYVPVRHGPDHMTGNVGRYPDRNGHPFETKFNKIVSTRRDLHAVGHHFNFDLMMCHGHGIHFIGTMEDTEVNDALFDEYATSHSLEAACQHAGTIAKKGDQLYKYLASKFGGDPTRRTQMGQYWKLPGDDPIGFDYAAGDGVSTWHLYQRQLEAAQEQDLDYIRILESRVTRATYRMIRHGIRIDEERLSEVIKTLETKVEEARRVVPFDLNINSAPQLYEYFRRLGVPEEAIKRTPTFTNKKGQPSGGNPSFDEDWLKRHPEGQPILVLRKMMHNLTTFALPLRDRHIYNGRVHANFTQMANDDFGTITGRFSSNNPNLQQVPKRDYESAKLLRSVFMPDEEKHWIDADESQCEPRLLAHYSQSRVLLDGYLARPFVDAHSAVAKAANIDRESGKRLNQTIITGGGKGKLVLMLGENGPKIYDDYFRAMPEVKRLQIEASNRLKRRGYVISLLGRRARLESYDKGYLAINRLLQCGNADIIKKAMADIDEYFEAEGDHANLLNTVHDALGMQADMKSAKGKKMIKKALDFMTDFGPDKTVHLSVPLVADYGIGLNWAEATFPEKKLSHGG